MPPEGGDRGRVVAKPAENLIGWLTKLRRWRRHAPGRLRHVDRERDLADRSKLRMLELREETSLDKLRVPDDLVEGENRSGADVRLLQELDPLGASPRPEQLAQLCRD